MTDEIEMSSDFMKQFSGSATANLLFGIAFMVYMGLKKLCNRDSKCKSHVHCCCLDLDVRDKTMRSSEKPVIEKGEEII